MKRIGMVALMGRENVVQAAESIRRRMEQENIDVFCDSALHETLPGTGLLRRGVSVDAVIALGGDGTILRAVPYAQTEDVPILGINMGSKGFLASAERGEVERSVHDLLAGTLRLEKRPLLTCSLDNQNLALNDIAILRLGRQRLVGVRASVDGEEIGTYHADGILVATPTGSTGYAMSAGGPIIMPNTPCLLLIPVCAHSLEQRPIVVPDTSEIELTMLDDPEMQGVLQMDGKTVGTMMAGNVVRISLSGKRISLARPAGQPFFDIVRHKLTEWREQA